MRRLTSLPKRLLPLAVTLALATSPLTYSAEDFNSLYEDAHAHYSKEDFDTARIQLKNALQENPRHLPSRLLLGRLYLRTGNAAAAESELRTALQMGAARDQVLSLLGNALLIQRKYPAILETLTTVNSSTLEAEQVYVFRGRAYLGLGQIEEAQVSFEQAASVAPDSIEAMLGLGAVLTANGQYSEAEALIDRARNLAPDSSAVWYEKARLREAFNDTEGALTSYNLALQLKPNSSKALVGRATLYLRLGQYEKSRQDLELVYERTPHDLNAAFVYSQLLVRMAETEQARDVLEGLQEGLDRIDDRIILREPLLLRIATLSKFMNRDIEQAIVYASRYLALKPNDPPMVKLLASIRLKMGSYDSASNILYPALRSQPNDPELLALYGEVLLQQGRFVQATNVLEQAAVLQPENAHIRTRLGLSRFGMGLAEQGSLDLARASELDTPASTSAGVILTQVLLRQGQQQQALESVLKLLERETVNPVLYNLLGAVHLSARNLAEARSAFERASEVFPGFQGSEYNLALLDIHENKLEDARSRLQALLKLQPESSLVLAALADLELAEGDSERAISWLIKASVSKDISPAIHAKLVDLYIAKGAPEDALREAQRLFEQAPQAQEARLAIARAQLAAGQQQNAIRSFKQAVQDSDLSGPTLLQTAAQQQALKDYDGARYTLFKATSSNQALAAKMALVRLDIITEKLDAAELRAKELQQQPETAFQGELFIGQIRSRQKRFDEALKAYRTSLNARPNTQAALGIFESQFILGQRDDALKWLEGWSNSHPNDLAARRTLARTYLSMGDYAAAKAEFERLIEQGQDDAVLYSRLARIYQLTGDSRALDAASKALRIAPDSSTVLDVYGWILVTEGNASDGLKYLREAVSRDSDPMMRYHLASALSELGRSDEARIELQAILQSRQSLPWISSAQNLYDSLPASQ